MTTMSLTPHHRAFFCFNVTNLGDTTRRNSTFHRHVFFCSNARGPHGHDDKELNLCKDYIGASTKHTSTLFMISCIIDHASIFHILKMSWIQKMLSIMCKLIYKNLHHMMTLTSVKKYKIMCEDAIKKVASPSHLISIPCLIVQMHYKKGITKQCLPFLILLIRIHQLILFFPKSTQKNPHNYGTQQPSY